jgi:formamidopyrimidine-DNA glycosylase
MPELAEVEYYRKQWDAGLGQRVATVEVHAKKRVFRGTDVKALVVELPGLRYRESWARGKRMLFRFGSNAWVALHLGMTGKLRTERLPFSPNKHDHPCYHARKDSTGICRFPAVRAGAVSPGGFHAGMVDENSARAGRPWV